MNKVAAFALWRKNSILSMSEKMFCPPQPLRFWITPAYAGKRIKLRKRHSICGDHPRVCGEKKKAEEMGATTKGSPPRVQGKGGRTGSSGRYTGITPACAGKRHARPDCPHGRRDHPCVCGEKPLVSFVADFSRGSPPRMRGKVKTPQKGLQGPRITPAYAGKRPLASLTTSTAKDHPRVCGEKCFSCLFSCTRWGSPPRMRGKETASACLHLRNGITPAYAGKRVIHDRIEWRTQDHPRVCGEKLLLPLFRLLCSGSPPRMRGKDHKATEGPGCTGITPAYAGKSSSSLGGHWTGRDHPRVCGEKTKKIP